MHNLQLLHKNSTSRSSPVYLLFFIITGRKATVHNNLKICLQIIKIVTKSIKQYYTVNPFILQSSGNIMKNILNLDHVMFDKQLFTYYLNTEDERLQLNPHEDLIHCMSLFLGLQSSPYFALFSQFSSK